jgi:hypothetical protein
VKPIMLGMKFTRRKLAALALAPAAAVLPAQTPPAGDVDAVAKSQLRANSEALAKLQIPMTTEPAFHFKA